MPPLPHPAPWTPVAGALLLGIVVAGVARRRLGPLPSALFGLLGLGLGLGWAADGALQKASNAATGYLLEASAGAPRVQLPPLRVEAGLGAALGIGLVGLLLVAGPAGTRAARAMRSGRGAYLAIAPAMLGLGVLVGIPFLFEIGLSLFHHDHGVFTFVGLQNFVDILRGGGSSFEPGTLPYALVLTVVWTVSNVLLHLGIGLALALLLQKPAKAASRVYRLLLIVPWAVPSYLTALIWKSMFDADVGAVNRILGLTGMSWMNGTGTAFLANLITNVWLGVPFMMVVCLGALSSIPLELYEAARVDGAGRLDQLLHITLPLLKPALLPAVLLGSIWTFNKFEVIYLVSEGRPDGATDILVTEAYRWAFERGLAQGGAYGYAAAYSVVIFAVLLVYGWMSQRLASAAEEALR
jgi:arabinogalactan oligomer/maltooligosaccharide transport system permease protein